MTIRRYDPRDDLIPADVDGELGRVRDLLARKRANPEEVRQTLERCEAHLARLEALKARQDIGPNAALAAFLADPAGVLADPDRWPTSADLADGADLLVDVYRQWLLARAHAAGDPWREASAWVDRYGTARAGDTHSRAFAWLSRHARMPFPVGKSCVEFRDGFPAAAARDMMPFADDAYALVLPVPAGDRDVTAFFLMHRVRSEVLVDDAWSRDLDRWMIDGTDVRTDPPRPRGFSDTRTAARTWWKSLAGFRIEPGQRNRPRDRTARDLVDALIDFKARNGPEPPTLAMFLAHALPLQEEASHPTTWKRLSRDWELSWPELRQAIYGAARRKRDYIDRG